MSFCLSLYPDSTHSSWNIEVELFLDVVVASKGRVLFSIPLLHSEEFQLSLTPGQSRKSFVLQVNQVKSALVCYVSYHPLFFNSEVISHYNTVYMMMINNVHFKSVSLWWPFGHGEQPLYDLKMEINLEGGETFNAQRKVTYFTVLLIL